MAVRLSVAVIDTLLADLVQLRKDAASEADRAAIDHRIDHALERRKIHQKAAEWAEFVKGHGLT